MNKQEDANKLEESLDVVPINLSKAIQVYKKAQASLGEFISDLEMESLGYYLIEDVVYDEGKLYKWYANGEDRLDGKDKSELVALIAKAWFGQCKVEEPKWRVKLGKLYYEKTVGPLGTGALHFVVDKNVAFVFKDEMYANYIKDKCGGELEEVY